jgi:hypothetical protein
MSDFSCRELSFQVRLCCRSLSADESSNFPVAPRTVAYTTTTNYQNLIVVLGKPSHRRRRRRRRRRLPIYPKHSTNLISLINDNRDRHIYE